MRVGPRLWITGFLLLLWTFLPAIGEAAEGVGRLAKRLAEEKDFRVRTQAALALGAASSPSAVKPLCGALLDVSATVRAAAAAALAKLNRGGSECLAARLPLEKSTRVRSSIRRALAGIESGPKVNPTTKYYVAIGRAKVTSGDPLAIDGVLRTAMRRAAKPLTALMIAPDDEETESAEALFRKHKKLKGFYLAPQVFEPKYQPSGLKVKLEIAVFTYPEQALLGSFSVDLTAQAVSPGDTEAETELLKMVSERALLKFSSSADRF